MNNNHFRIRAAVVSDRGLSEKRPQNEDSFLMLEDSGLFAVADGVGGAQAGDVASEMATEILGEAFINLNEGGDPEARMKAAIEQANAAIFQMSQDLPSLSTMATTLVALHIHDNIATIGHVGDSRLYRVDDIGMLFRETQDHSVVEEEVRAGRMTREQAENHPSRNVISRALGAESTVEIDMKTIMFDPGTTFLICSDGITRHIPDSELQMLLSGDENPSEICSNLKDLCYERGAEDNLTAVVVKVSAAEVAQEDDFPELELEEDVSTVASVRTVNAPPTQPLNAADLIELETEGLPAVPISDVGALNDSVPELEIGRFDDEESLEDTLENFDPDDQLADEEEILLPTREGISPQTGMPETSDSLPMVPEAGPGYVSDVKSYRVDELSGSGVFGKLISGFLWLLTGLVIGALVGYLLLSSILGPSPISESAGGGNEVLKYEMQRRLVDADPGKYLSVYSTAKLSTASDYYLVGRAYLIQKNFGGAKTAFENAQEALKKETGAKSSVLAHDIAVGLAIAGDEQAQKSFESLTNPNQGNAEEPKPEG